MNLKKIIYFNSGTFLIYYYILQVSFTLASRKTAEPLYKVTLYKTESVFAPLKLCLLIFIRNMI